ncbi:hypothetical protein D8X87_07455 [Listeria innocua]|nr:hypothetical protein [Listeria innocua]EAC4267058.1 hypothetical protein [Listeria innocua]MBM5682692.1 hypothetical protein [Listeria innocua]
MSLLCHWCKKLMAKVKKNIKYGKLVKRVKMLEIKSSTDFKPCVRLDNYNRKNIRYEKKLKLLNKVFVF